MVNFDELMKNPVSRRAFLTRMSAAGLGAAAASLLAGCGGSSDNKFPSLATPTPTPTPTTGFDPINFPGIPGRSEDEVVLNYALTLENLEADLYRQALNIASGQSITAPLRSGLPSGPTGTNGYTLAISAGGIASEFVTPAFVYLAQYAYVEAAHRDFLRTALQSIGAPVAAPNPKGYTAPLGNTLSSLLSVILTLEETGVRAYLGAAGFITNVQYLTTAVAIHSTEARHSAAVNYVLGNDPGPSYLPGDRNVLNKQQSKNPSPYNENTFQYYLDPPTVINAVQPFFVK